MGDEGLRRFWDEDKVGEVDICLDAVVFVPLVGAELKDAGGG